MTTYGTIPTSSYPAGTSVNLEYISRAKERLKAGLGNRRPWLEMFEIHHFDLPKSFSDAVARVGANIAYFRLNYAIVVLLIVFLSLLWYPISLIVFIAMMAVWLFLYFLRDELLVVSGRVITDRVALIVLSVATIAVLLLTDATSNIVSALESGVVVVLIHGAMTKTDNLISDKENAGGDDGDERGVGENDEKINEMKEEERREENTGEKSAKEEEKKEKFEEVVVSGVMILSTKAIPEDDELSSSCPKDGVVLNHALSSSFMDVYEWKDGIEKKKNEDFVMSPNTTTPREKQKVATCKGHPQRKMEESYKPRADFSGYAEISEKERRFIEMYLDKDDLNVIVWKDANFSVNRDSLFALLFGAHLGSNLIDGYMRIICSPSYREKYGSNVYCLDAIVMKNTKHDLKNKGSQLGLMMGSTQRILEKLTVDVLNNNRFIIIPLHRSNHWFLLVFDTKEKKFIRMNSLWSFHSKRTTEVFAEFLSELLLNSLGYDIGKTKVVSEFSRQQKKATDSGVYMCLWAETFANNTRDSEAYADNWTADKYRARMAITILGHENGLLYGQME